MNSAFHAAFWDGRIADIPVKTDQLWRYMDLWKLVSMLEHRALYFPVVASLADQLEAVPPRLPDGSNETERWQQWQFWMQWRSTFFVSCWHNALDESAGMWEIHAARNQGIAVQSTLPALSEAFRPAGAETPPAHLIKAGLVEYICAELQEPMFRRGEGDKHLLRKRTWYEYERELRVYIEDCSNFVEPGGPQSEGHPRRKGILVECDLHTLIKSVVVAPASPPFFVHTLRKLIDRFGLDSQLVRESRLNEKFAPPDPIRLTEEWQLQSKARSISRG